MTTNTPSILFFTCATGYYENFVIPYIYFAELHNPGAKFEFIVNDSERFLEKHRESLHWLKVHRSVTPVIRSIPEMNAKPRMDNSIRFITTPHQIADQVYIGDVDIMIFDDIRKWHQPVFDAGLPYSNIVRTNTRRLTGLHYTTYEGYYPLPSIDDLIANTPNDEELLYKIVERKGSLYETSRYNQLVRGRPVHGLHMSLNRFPFSAHAERVSWGMSYAHLEQCNNVLNSNEFGDFFSAMSNGPRQILVNLIYLSHGVISLGRERFSKLVFCD